MGSINNLSSYLQSELSSVLQPSNLPTNTTASIAGRTSASSVVPQTDNQQLSPFAQLMNELQQLQQSDPTKYAQVTGQIGANLQNAAKTAQANGNSTAANQLNELSADFTSASQSGQLPNFQDLSQAAGSHHHGHHHHHSQAASTDSTSSTDGTSGDPWTSSNQSLAQFLPSFQANGSQSDSPDPATIIQNTLSTAGFGSSHS
jgi:hypothetical protein